MFLLVCLYVDDLIFTGNDETLFSSFKYSMMKEFDMTDLGRMRYFLGLEVLQRTDGIFICQKKYAQEVLERFNMASCTAVFNPIVPGFKMDKDSAGMAVDSTMYMQMVGSLMYLTSTRPDIMFVVSLLSRYLAHPTALHLQAVKRVLRYIKGTLTYGIFYKKGGNKELLAYTDSDYAGDLEDRKSTSGFSFLLSSGAVSWSSKKQPVVTLSTTEAEFIAAASCACQAVWLRRMLEQLNHASTRATVIFNKKYPVRSQVEPGYLKKCLPDTAPYNPESMETIMKDIQNHIVPGLTHWQSPNYFAYFPSSGSTSGFLGEMLSTGFNVVGFNWMSSPAATELETIVMDWLGKMLKLPNSFLFSGNGGGVLQGTTCEAILCTLTAARDRKLNGIGRENIGRLVVYGSDQTHCALQKAAQIAGINPSNFRAVATSKKTNFGLSPESLTAAIVKDLESGLVPLFLCPTVGTTSSTAVDPIGPLCDVAKEYGLWVHIDAAYAGSACICPEFRHFIDGVESADSFSFNAHKWFFTTLDCCCLWVKDPSALVKSLSTNPEYLRNKATESKQVVDYKDWQIALSRLFRSMKLWMVLRTYGVANLRNFLRTHVKMAKHFEGLVAMDKRFEIVVPRNFAMVCFRLLPPADDGENGSADGRANELNRKLLEAINSSGRIYMTHAVVGGTYMIRFAVGATLTEDRHVNLAWKVVKEHADSLVNSMAEGHI
ncbi:hypothetical protein MRB53_024726 [Persea americana]|uniref:Uncharacterized protein n=1 Tax=Persea americana TaxID=3435 RepID=A0ACC2LDK3_PERAE|nr:hypothetical protein MRB53_024726 [Persea americana]